MMLCSEILDHKYILVKNNKTKIYNSLLVFINMFEHSQVFSQVIVSP